MLWVKAIAAAALVAVGCSAEAAAQAIVLRSTGPSARDYPVGRRMPVSATITLAADDKVIVLDRVSTRVLSGPGTFKVDNVVNRNITPAIGIAGVLKNWYYVPGSRGFSLRVLGNVPQKLSKTESRRQRKLEIALAEEARRKNRDKAFQAAREMDSVWYVDPAKGGDYCIVDFSKIVLRSPNISQPYVVRIVNVAGQSTRLVWRKGSEFMLWPNKALPPGDGEIFNILQSDQRSINIKFHKLEKMPADNVELVAAFSEYGCSAQIDAMANVVDYNVVDNRDPEVARIVCELTGDC